MPSVALEKCSLSGFPLDSFLDVSFAGPTHTPFLKSAVSHGLAFSPVLSVPLLGAQLLVTTCRGSPLAGGATHCNIIQRQSEDGFCHVSGAGTV